MMAVVANGDDISETNVYDRRESDQINFILENCQLPALSPSQRSKKDANESFPIQLENIASRQKNIHTFTRASIM